MMNRLLPGFLVTIGVSCLFFGAKAQTKKSSCFGFQDSILHKFVYKTVDKIPEPAGGLDRFFKYLSKHIKSSSSRQETGGRIIVAFVVEKNGRIDGGRIVRDIAIEGHFFGKQLFNTCKSYKWKAGSCSGKPVPVLYFIPLTIDTQE